MLCDPDKTWISAELGQGASCSCCTCPQQTGSVLVWKFRQIAKFESVLRGAGCPGSTVERWSSVFISVPPWCSWVIHEQPGVKQTHMRSQLSPLSWDSEPPCCLYGLPAIRSSCFSAGNSHLCWAIMELRGWNTNCAFWERVCAVCVVSHFWELDQASVYSQL